MNESKNLETVICGLNPQTNLPKHCIIVPKNDSNLKIPLNYCFDSRKHECDYCLISGNKSYCNYDS